MTTAPRPRMTTLQAYAAHGSTSHGEISPERFAEIVRGDTPTAGEKVCVCQGLTEMHATPIGRDVAGELAAEIGATRAELEARCQELCRVALGANAFPEALPAPPKLIPDHEASCIETEKTDVSETTQKPAFHYSGQERKRVLK